MFKTGFEGEGEPGTTIIRTHITQFLIEVEKFQVQF